MSVPSQIKRVSQQTFGQLSSGEQATLYTLTNKHGMQVNITNYGGVIVSLFTPDKTGRFTDIVLGYDNVSDYEKDSYYLGAVIGRYAGRIDQGQFELDGKQYQLTLNAPDSQLHGGTNALNKKLWQASTTHDNDKSSLNLTVISSDGEEGYPGSVEFTVKYTLNDKNELLVEYFANTDKTTIVNLTQHSYFNLAGHNSGNVQDHHVAINADHFLPMNNRAYPTGEIKAVNESPHDFRQLKPLAQGINADDEQIIIGNGYDNYWLANESALTNQEPLAKVYEPNSGRRMRVYSDQPSVILYTANYIDGSHIGKNNTRYQKRDALCIEPQRANNKIDGVTINNTKLTPAAPFYSQSRYVFDIIE